jgi:hypothetical protein
MKISVLLVTVLTLTSATIEAADVLTPGFLKVSLYTNITGTAVSALTADPRYPLSPSEVRYLRSFNTRDALPNDALENFGAASKALSLRWYREITIFFCAAMTRRNCGSAPMTRKLRRS